MEETVAGKRYVPLWGEKMPGTRCEGEEHLFDPGRDTVLRITDVSQPGMYFFPAEGSGPHPVMVVCPGGGYSILAWNLEGTEIAERLNASGLSVFVLKYRVPGNRAGAFMDVQRAIRLVRAHHGEFDVDPAKVGVMGFSAGGHLSAMALCSDGKASYDRMDEADDESPLPDYAALVYPAYLNDGDAMAPEFAHLGKVPPVILLHNEQDLTFVPGTKVFTRELKAQGYDVTTKIWQEGGHGYGLRSDKDVKAWPDEMVAWIAQKGFLN